MQVRRIGPDGAFVREFTEVRKRVESLESRPAGEQFISQSLTTRDPETGVETVFGLLSDGTFGIQPFVGDITPPPIASKPVVSAQPGTLTIQWDGKFLANAAKPRDFEHVNVIGYKMVNGNDVLSLTVGAIRLKTDFAFVTTDVIAVGETWQFALESEDYNGNKANAGARTNTITMLSVMDDTNITDALNALAAEDAALNDRADDTQADLLDAQELADALLEKGANLAINSSFDLPLVAGKPIKGWTDFTLSSVVANASAAYSGANLLRAAPTASSALAYTNWFSFAKDRTVYVEYWVKLEATAPTPTGVPGVYFTSMKLDGSTSVSPQGNISGIGGASLTAADLSTTSYTKVWNKYKVTSFDLTKMRVGPRLTGSGNVYYIDNFKVMDITEAEAAQVKADSAFANAQQAADAAGTAQTAADGRSKNWYQDDAPAGVGHKNGDTWFDTNDGNKIYSWSTATSAWVNRQDTAIAANAVAITGAQATANGKNTSYFGTTAPTGGTYKSGDLFFNTAEGNKLYLWSTTGGVTAWKPFQDNAIVIANQAATGAQATADGKNKSYYTDTAPTNVPAGTLKQGDLWFNTGAGQGNRLSTWSGTAWQTTQDSALAMIEVAKKGRTFTGGVQPALEFRNTSNIWIDTSLGDGFAVTKRWDTTANDWVPVKDAAISQAQTDAALDAQAKADAAYTASINAQGFSRNPSFDDWTSTVPNNYAVWSTASTIVKETSTVKRGKNALRFSVPDTATQGGLNLSSGALTVLPNLEFYTVELEFYLVSGALDGAGVRIDWTGLSPANSVTSMLYLPSEVPGAVTGKWYRVSKVLRRSTTATGTWTGTAGYLMGNYSGFSGFGGAGAAKELIIDWFNVRPSSVEEILAYNAPTTTYVDSASVAASAAALVASASDATTKANNAQAAAIADTTTRLLGKNKTVWSASSASGTAGYIAGDTWFQRDGTGAVIGQWEFSTTPTPAWLSRTVSENVIGNLSAGKIVTGVLDADRIGVNTITADKVFVGDFTNLAADGAFTDLTKKNWTGTSTVVAVANEPNRLEVLTQAVNNADQKNTNVFQVTAGEQIYGEIWVYGDPANVGGGGANLHLRVVLNTGTNSFPAFATVTRAAASGVWTLLKGVVTIPANAKTAVVEPTVTFAADGVGNKYQFRLANVRRMAAGNLIVDGAIDGKTITGALIQTDSSAVTGTAGRGIKLTTTELAGYDAAGQKNFSLTTGGTLAVRGTIQSGSTISGANLSASGIYTNPASQRGVKIMDTGINAWDVNGVPTFVLNAATGEVEVPGLKASSITGDMIAGGTISANNIAVSDFTNYATINELTGQTVTSYGQTTVSAGYNKLVVDSGTFFMFTDQRGPNPFKVGDKLLVQFTAKATASTTANFVVYTYDSVGSNSNTTVALSKNIGTTDTVFSEVITITTVKANAVQFVLGLGSVANKGIQVKNVKVTRQLAGELIVDGAITTDHMTSNTIDAKVIATGTLTGDKIEAGAITAEKLTVGIGTNLIPDPGFMNPGVTTIRQTASTAGLTVAANATTDNLDLTTATTGTYYFRASGVLQSASVYKDWIPVVPGEKYLFSVNITLPTGMTGDVRITGRTKDGQNTSTSFALENSDAIPPVPLTFPLLVAGLNTIKYYAKVPANAYWMLPEIRLASAIGTATIEPNSMSIRRRSTGELIVDGSITTNHMTVGSIDGGVISANSLKGTQIQAASITASNLLLTSQDNLVENGGFEYGLTSWTNVTQFTADASGGRFGGGAMKVTGITARVFGPLSSNYVAVEGIDGYRVSGWIKTTATSGHRGELCLYWYDADKVNTGNTNYYIDPTGNDDPTGVAPAGIPLDGTWRYFSKLIVPAVGSAAYVRIRINATMTAASGTMWYDDVSLVRAANASLIVDGSIQTSHITAGAIDATKLSANAVTASAISGKSITADKLIISSSNNLLIEPDFGLNGISWTLGTYISVNATAGRGSTPALRVTGTTAAQNSYNLIAKGPDVTNKVAVDDDNRFRASFWVKSTEALPANAVKLAFRRYTTATAQTAFTMIGNPATLVPNVWTQVQGISPALPSNIIACDFYLIVDNLTTGGVTDIDAVSVTRASDGNLVVDGSIDGKTITGASIQTSPSANRGIKIDSTGLNAYNPVGAPTVVLDGVTGNLTSTGIFQTAVSGQRVKIWDHGDTIAAMDMFPDTSAQHGALFSEKVSSTYYTRLLHFQVDGGAAPNLTLSSAGSIYMANAAANGNVTVKTDGTILLDGTYIDVRGRARSGQAVDDWIVYGSSTQTAVAAGTFTFTYGSPVANGTRAPIVTGDGINPVQWVTQSCTASGFLVKYSGPASNNTSFRYTAMWTP